MDAPSLASLQPIEDTVAQMKLVLLESGYSLQEADGQMAELSEVILLQAIREIAARKGLDPATVGQDGESVTAFLRQQVSGEELQAQLEVTSPQVIGEFLVALGLPVA